MRRKKRSSNRSHRHAGRTCKLQQRAGRQRLGGPAQHATPSGPVQHGPEQVQLAQELAAAQAGARGPGNKVEQQPSLHIRWPKLQGSTSRPSPCEVAAHKVTHARCTGRTSSQADSREQVLPHFVTPLTTGCNCYIRSKCIQLSLSISKNTLPENRISPGVYQAVSTDAWMLFY